MSDPACVSMAATSIYFDTYIKGQCCQAMAGKSKRAECGKEDRGKGTDEAMCSQV